jgi:hypothetical protein
VSITLATPANMRDVESRQYPNARRHVFAFSPTSGEEYSATPDDYFAQPDDEPLRDANGEPMILATRQTIILDALTGERV